MRSTFAGLELARRALESQQTALTTVGHNISNASTVGYTRQVVNLRQTAPERMEGHANQISVGTGATVSTINRIRDTFVDRQFRWETSKQNYWEGQQNALEKIEGVFNEPSDFSLSNDFDRFWSAWSDLAKNPENTGARSVVLERGATIVDSLHNINQQLNSLQRDLDGSVRVQIEQVNVYAEQIRDYNTQIKRAEVAGDSPNDLRDQRDQLIDELSKIANVYLVEGKDPRFTDREVSTFALYIGNENIEPKQLLVSDSTLNQLEIPPAPGIDGLPFASVRWSAQSTESGPVDLGNKLGSLQALLSMRGMADGTTPGKDEGYIDNLKANFDTLTKQLAGVINYLHEQGVGSVARTSNSFFVTAEGETEITAANIRINPELRGDVRKISTGQTAYTDGKIAQAMASLATNFDTLYSYGWERSSPPVEGLSFGDYYGSVIAAMGVDVQQANRMAGGQEVLVSQMANRRESISGVSLDEEMTNLVKYQKSYSAAARIVTVLDDMLDTIVKGMGITR